MSTAAFSRRRWHHVRVPVRFPRVRFVLGDSISVGWVFFTMAAFLAIGAASWREEVVAEEARAELLRERAALIETTAHCLDDELACENVLATCARVVGDGLSCACAIPADMDGAR